MNLNAEVRRIGAVVEEQGRAIEELQRALAGLMVELSEAEIQAALAPAPTAAPAQYDLEDAIKEIARERFGAAQGQELTPEEGQREAAEVAFAALAAVEGRPVPYPRIDEFMGGGPATGTLPADPENSTPAPAPKKRTAKPKAGA